MKAQSYPTPVFLILVENEKEKKRESQSCDFMSQHRHDVTCSQVTPARRVLRATSINDSNEAILQLIIGETLP